MKKRKYSKEKVQRKRWFQEGGGVRVLRGLKKSGATCKEKRWGKKNGAEKKRAEDDKLIWSPGRKLVYWWEGLTSRRGYIVWAVDK